MIERSNIGNELFEGMNLTGIDPQQLQNSKKLYNYIVESYEIAQEEGKELSDVMDEGVFSAIALGALGATAGPSIMKAVCKCLGINETGCLGQLLTSRVVLAAVCGELGLRL